VKTRLLIGPTRSYTMMKAWMIEYMWVARLLVFCPTMVVATLITLCNTIVIEPDSEAEADSEDEAEPDVPLCAICLGGLHDKSIGVTSCGHLFHQACFNMWKETRRVSNRYAQRGVLCPL
jgi:hypothetical protein